jgi:hypothetical protein
MTGQELLDIFHLALRRTHIIGTPENGIIVALDLEGRLFAVLNNKVLNRVVPSAIINLTNKLGYLNPGGDALWPAPEGTCFGYEYGTGKWRVPPEITGSVWEVIGNQDHKSIIKSEIDLVNNRQLGIPCEFERHIEVKHENNSLIQEVTELIRYIGERSLNKDEFRLAPWSLCQFDSGNGCKVIMPAPSADDIHDFYESSLSKQRKSGEDYWVDMNTDFRFQLGLGEKITWIEFRGFNNLLVRRSTGPLQQGQRYIDIADSPPDQFPSEKGVRLSVYCDPSGFMELEACGGCPDTLFTGTELSIKVITEYKTKPPDEL